MLEPRPPFRRRAAVALVAAGLAVLFCAPRALCGLDPGPSLQRLADEARSLSGSDIRPSAQQPEAPASAAVAASRRQKEWTVMVYMNGKNDLGPFALADINTMEAVGSTDQVDVVVEVGHLGKYQGPGLILPGHNDWDGLRCYHVARDDSPDLITSLELPCPSPIIPGRGAPPEGDMGDWNRLVRFVGWAQDLFPARRYMLVVWNHGAGWQGISFDEASGNEISVPALGQALAKIGREGRLDVFASDACLMQMAEVAYEIKDAAPVIVGSEESEPGEGYDYRAWLEALTGDPGLGPEGLGRAVVKTYGRYYAAQGTPATQSALRASALEGLRTRLDAWAAAVMASGDREAVRTAQARVKRFEEKDSADLYDLVSKVGKKTQDAGVRSAGEELNRFIKEQLIIENVAPRHPGSHGIAIYLPVEGYHPSHGNLSWAHASRWPEFLRWALGN